MTKKSENVVVLGASDNPERYSHQAILLLKEHGHNPIPVHPKLATIEGLKCFLSLDQISAQKIKVDTLTMYVNPKISSSLYEAITKLAPTRIIFNPGTENQDLADRLGIPSEEACTLVLLRTNQY